MAIDSPVKTLSSRPAFLRSAAMLSGVLIVLGSAGPSIAQTPPPKADMARCNQLHGVYSKYSGRVNYMHSADVDNALEDCRKGKFAAGVAGLTVALQRAGIPVPPEQTEQPRQASAPLDDAAYCAALGKAYRQTAPQHQNPSAVVPTAVANCAAGNTAAGIPVLEQALRNGGMTVPTRTQ